MSNETTDTRLIGRNIIRIGDYVNIKTLINWQCTRCSHQWQASPDKILNQKTGCPMCAGRPKVTNNSIDNELKQQKRPIQRIGNYVNAPTKIEWQCLNNKTHAWLATPKDVVKKGTGCPHCRTGIFGKKITYTNGLQFKSKREAYSYNVLLEYFNETDIELQKRYNSSSKHTCDFFIRSKNWWIEIGNIKTKKYLATLDQKRDWILAMNQTWNQFDSSVDLQRYLIENT